MSDSQGSDGRIICVITDSHMDHVVMYNLTSFSLKGKEKYSFVLSHPTLYYKPLYFRFAKDT